MYMIRSATGIGGGGALCNQLSKAFSTTQASAQKERGKGKQVKGTQKVTRKESRGIKGDVHQACELSGWPSTECHSGDVTRESRELHVPCTSQCAPNASVG